MARKKLQNTKEVAFAMRLYPHQSQWLNNRIEKENAKRLKSGRVELTKQGFIESLLNKNGMPTQI